MAKSHAEAAQLDSSCVCSRYSVTRSAWSFFSAWRERPVLRASSLVSLPISRTAIVQHLKLLEAAGLVGASVQGRRRVYGVQAEGLAPLARWLAEHSRTRPMKAVHRSPNMRTVS